MGLDSTRKVADVLLEATPDFEASGGKVISPQGPLKDMPQSVVSENIVIFYSPEGNFLKPKGWAMAYFMDTPQAAQAMKRGEIGYPMFMPGSLNMRFGGYSMIDAIWKKPKARRGQSPEETASLDAMKHVVGALEAYVLDDRLFVDNLSVRPGWKRNSIGSKLMQAVRDNWPDKEMTHSDATDQGKKFLNKTGQWNPDKKLARQAELEPVRPTVRDLRKEKETTESVDSILASLLEEEDKPDEWIGVDLDGTLAKYTEWKGPTKIGEPIPKMVARIRRWVGHGKKVKIFTARADDEKSVNAIKKWLKDNELPDLEVTNLKDQHMTELWDDRAVAVQKNTGEVKEALEPLSDDDYRWGAQMLRMIRHKGILGIPVSQQAFQVDHQAKTLTLIEGPAAGEFMDKLRELFAAFDYKIITPGADEMTVIEAYYHEEPKPAYAYGETDDELEVASRQPFTAHELAVRRGRHHPKLWQRVKGSPYENEYRRRFNPTEAIIDHLLQESPTIATLEKHRIDLEPEERKQIMKAKAVWPFGKNGADSPAVHKALVKGKHWYWCNTHRCGQVRSTLKAAISAFHNIVEPTA